MKYYSEKLNKVFDTTEALESAEKDYQAKEAEKAKLTEVKKQRADEIKLAYKKTMDAREQARKIIKEADDNYYKLRDKFVEDYGSYHMSYYNDGKNERITLDDVLDSFFHNFDNLLLPW